MYAMQLLFGRYSLLFLLFLSETLEGQQTATTAIMEAILKMFSAPVSSLANVSSPLQTLMMQMVKQPETSDTLLILASDNHKNTNNNKPMPG